MTCYLIVLSKFPFRREKIEVMKKFKGLGNTGFIKIIIILLIKHMESTQLWFSAAKCSQVIWEIVNQYTNLENHRQKKSSPLEATRESFIFLYWLHCKFDGSIVHWNKRQSHCQLNCHLMHWQRLPNIKNYFVGMREARETILWPHRDSHDFLACSQSRIFLRFNKS